MSEQSIAKLKLKGKMKMNKKNEKWKIISSAFVSNHYVDYGHFGLVFSISRNRQWKAIAIVFCCQFRGALSVLLELHRQLPKHSVPNVKFLQNVIHTVALSPWIVNNVDSSARNSYSSIVSQLQKHVPTTLWKDTQKHKHIDDVLKLLCVLCVLDDGAKMQKKKPNPKCQFISD